MMRGRWILSSPARWRKALLPGGMSGCWMPIGPRILSGLMLRAFAPLANQTGPEGTKAPFLLCRSPATPTLLTSGSAARRHGLVA
jgi:hypothetical protein